MKLQGLAILNEIINDKKVLIFVFRKCNFMKITLTFVPQQETDVRCDLKYSKMEILKSNF